MRTRTTWLWVLILSGACMGFAGSALAANESNDAVQAANDAFYAALNTMFTGDAGPMEAVWSHSDEVTYMGPDGSVEIGWPKVQAIWEKQAQFKMGGKITPELLQTISGSHMGVTYTNEVGENTDADGNTVKVSIRATNIFQNEDGQWKMVGHHTDLLPFLVEENKAQ